jgi:hypothetical protein
MRDAVRALGLCVILLAAYCCGGQPSAPAVPGRSLEIPQFFSSVTVLEDGTIRVQERVVATFHGAWHGLYRTIPIDYRTPQGLNYSLHLQVERVTDDSWPLTSYESRREGRYLVLVIPLRRAENTSRTIEITYVVDNALRFFEDHDELYWNVTGNGWDVPIGAAAASITLPMKTDGIRATAFRGARGSTEAASTTVRGQLVSMDAKGLGLHEGLTAVVGWNPGIIARPTRGAIVGDMISSNWSWPAAFPILVLGGMGLLWLFRGRDPKAGTVTTSYEPPSELSPAETGTLIDGCVDMRDLTATLVDLAVRRYVRIEEDKGQYSFTSLKPESARSALKNHESLLLEALFRTGDHVTPADLKNEFSMRLPDIREAVYLELVMRDFYSKSPGQTSRPYYIAGIILMCAPPALDYLSVRLFDGAAGLLSWSAIASGIVSGIILMAFSRIMPARTRAGTREYAKVRGFQEFLSRVDADRLQRVVKTPAMFEKYLPYAMAFGVAAEWTAPFRGICTERPLWYGSADGSFNPDLLQTHLQRMSIEVGRSMSFVAHDGNDSVWFAGTRDFSESSGSVGSSGFSGGSSGGGFGGGGGGGF